MKDDYSEQEMRIECIAVLKKLHDIVEYYNSKRNSSISTIETSSMEMMDLSHYIELNFVSYDEYRCRELMDIYQTTLKQRRKAKDCLKMYEILNNMLKHGANPVILKKTINEIEKLNTRIYTPRILKDLWNEDGVSSFDELGRREC